MVEGSPDPRWLPAYLYLDGWHVKMSVRVEYERRSKRKVKGERSSPTREALLKILEKWRREHSYGPTVAEMSELLGVETYAVRHHLDKLRAIGKVEVDISPTGKVIGRSWRVRYG